MKALRPFPTEYKDNPKRRAERRIYDELSNCDLPGCFTYEWKSSKQQYAEADFVVWIEGVGLFCIQVKGGNHRYERRDAEWQLWKGGDWERVPSPTKQTWNGAQGLMDSLPKRNGYHTFVLPVLLFPDMDVVDEAIDADNHRGKVHVLAGAADLADKLEGVARERGVHYPPNADDIDDDVRTITHGTYRYTPAGPDDEPDAEIYDVDGDRVLKAPRMDIGHVEHFHQSHDRSIHLHFHGAQDAESMAALARGLAEAQALPPRE